MTAGTAAFCRSLAADRAAALMVVPAVSMVASEAMGFQF